MQKDKYLGIASEYSSLYKQSGSKFLGFITPIIDEEDAKNRISEFRGKYADATHVCSAYVLGTERELQYFSDDGEPSNSAGRPILHALLSSNTSYLLGIVVRYYGGKKLGVPGLIQAYGTAAQECLEQAEIKEMELKSEIYCSIDPAASYHLYNFLHARKDIQYEMVGSEFKLQCAQSMTPELRSELDKIPTLVVRE